MDAASNNSVEDIRNIKENVNFLPTMAKYRVYIIDEVHMLSTAAFNALLKTLEEPPEHVKFILATTEPQKLLATILSRCQRFDFKKISNDNIIKRLKLVCNESNIQITDTALNLISSLSEGAARDALSILERCLQDGETNIDENKIKDLVGIPKFVYVNNIIKGIIEKDIENSLKAIHDVLEEGKDLENFLWEMIKYTKDILIYKVTNQIDIYSEEEKSQIEIISDNVSKQELTNIIYKLSELENKMKMSSQKIIIFETEIIKLCVKSENLKLEDRIKKLEEVMEKGVNISPKQVTQEHKEYKIQDSYYDEKVKDINANKKEASASEGIRTKALSNGNVVKGWQNVINNLKSQGKVILYANLINTEVVEINDMTIAIRFSSGLNSFRRELLEKSENMNVLTKEISVLCGKPMQIKFEDASSQNKTATKQENRVVKTNAKEEKQEEDILDTLDIPINFVEEE